jgi:hypothetical protein
MIRARSAYESGTGEPKAHLLLASRLPGKKDAQPSGDRMRLDLTSAATINLYLGIDHSSWISDGIPPLRCPVILWPRAVFVMLYPRRG